MSHENGGSYCIDSTGSFHFVKGYDNLDIGTEITLQTKKPSRIRRFCIAFVAVAVVAAIAGFTCVKFTSSEYIGGLGSNTNDAAVYARLCINDSTRYCQEDEVCDTPCPCY